MNSTQKNYGEYLESYTWKAVKEKKLSDNFNCACCGLPATTVHHLSYERLGKEDENDLVSICDSCHNECHFIDGEKILNEENILRDRFEQVKLSKQKKGIENLILNDEEEDIDNKTHNKGEKIGNLYSDQYQAYNNIVDFINSNNEVFILKGAAGTGKTTLLKEIKDYFTNKNLSFFFGAPTGKATYVLKDKLELIDNDTYGTIYSILYKIKDSLDKGNKNVNYFDKQELLEDYIYIIDESSLLNYKSSLDNDMYQKDTLNFGTGSLLKDIFSAKKSKSTKIIFVGDAFQLPPINDESRALNKNFLESHFNVTCNEAELTRVKRQTGERGEGILRFSEKIREDITDDNYKMPFLENNEDVIILNNKEELLNKYAQNINDSIILSYTNEKVLEYNNKIRESIKKFKNTIEVGDKIMIGKNTLVGDEQFLNGEIVEIVNILGDIELKKDIFVNNKIKNDLLFLDVTIKRDFGKEIFFDVKLILNSIDKDNGSGEDTTLGKFLFSDLLNRTLNSKNNPNGVWKKSTKGGTTRYYKNEDNIDEDNKEFKNKVLKEDKYFNSLEIKYGYALTCHKSQGSEWENIFLDIDDYVHGKINRDFFKFLYTAITRGKNKVYILNSDKLLEKGNYGNYSSKFSIDEEWINEFINKIGTILNGYNYELKTVFIEGVEVKDWKVVFIFSNGSSKAHITFTYNKKGFTGNAQLHNKDNSFTNNIRDLLIKHNVIKHAY